MTLLLLPGMDGTGRLFAPLADALPKWIRPVVVPYPPDRSLDYPGHLEIVRRAIPDDEPCVLLGESFSGPLALMAAAERRPAVRGVILCATFIRSPLPPPLSRLSFLVTPATVDLIPWSIRRRMLLGQGGSDAGRKLLDSIHGTVSPEVMATRARSILELDCSDALRDCPVPLLYIAASRDRIVTRASLDRIRQLRPDIAVAEIEGPHLILQESPVTAASIIEEFVRRATSPS